MFVIDSKSSFFERFIELIMDFNKHSLLFGIPHKAIVFKESAISSFENNVNIHISKEYFSAKAKLKDFDLASVLVNQSLYEEKSLVFSKYCVDYQGERVLKISKRPIAQIALQGMKNSINNSFNKIGIDDFSSPFSKILNNTLKFVETQNV